MTLTTRNAAAAVRLGTDPDIGTRPDARPNGGRVKVRMRTHISGTRNGQPWPPAGGVIELPDEEGAALCAQGSAEPVADKPADRAEKAVAPEAEQRDHDPAADTGTSRRGPGRPRRSDAEAER